MIRRDEQASIAFLSLGSNRGVLLLLFSYVALSILLAFAATLQLLSSNNLRLIQISLSANDAFWRAEGMLDQGRAQLDRMIELPVLTPGGCMSFSTTTLGSSKLCLEQNTRYRIEATGLTTNGVSYLLTAVVNYTMPTVKFDQVAYVTQALTLSNSSTGSLNTATAPSLLTNLTFNGDVATTQSAPRKIAGNWLPWIQLSGSSTVQGRALVGPGGNPNDSRMISAPPPSSITGARSTLSSLQSLPQIVVPAFAQPLGDANHDLLFDGSNTQDLFLHTGTYYVRNLFFGDSQAATSDTLGGTRLWTMGDGPVELYVIGDTFRVDAGSIRGCSAIQAGGTVCANSPKDLRIHYTGTTSGRLGKQTSTGSINAYTATIVGVVYAPNAHLDLNDNLTHLGGFIANDATINSSHLFYDDALSGKTVRVYQPSNVVARQWTDPGSLSEAISLSPVTVQ